MSIIQIIREQVADTAIDSSKIDLANGTYNFASGAVLQATTASQGDNSTKAATTAYVDLAVSNAAVSEGPGIDVTGNKISVDADLGTSGLTFSASGDAGKLQLALNPSDPNGMEITPSGFLGVALEANGAGGIEFVGSGTDQGALKVALIASTGLTFNANGIAIAVEGSTIAASTSGIKVAESGITATQLASNAVTNDKILNGTIANGKLENSSVSFGGVSLALGASDATPAFDLADATNYPTSALVGTIVNSQVAANAIKNAQIDDSAVGIDEVSFESKYEQFTGNGSTAAYTLSAAPIFLEFVQVYMNGLRMSFLASGTPANDQYTISGTTLTFGANIADASIVQVSYLTNGTPA